MGTLHTFPPRAAGPVPLPPPSPAETRRLIEKAAQTALDTADALLAILDRMDGDADREDDGDAEPDLGVPEGHGSQVVHLRGVDSSREAATPVAVVPPSLVARGEVLPWPLPWSGSSNVISVAGSALLEMVTRRSCR